MSGCCYDFPRCKHNKGGRPRQNEVVKNHTTPKPCRKCKERRALGMRKCSYCGFDLTALELAGEKP